MPSPIRMPSRDRLPPGPRRVFVAEFFDLYRAASRPALRVIDEKIKNDEELAGTASRETIRRVLSGQGVPPTWATVEAIMIALSQMAGINPGESIWVGDDDEGYQTSRYAHMKDLWNKAIDDEDDEPADREPLASDPWGDDEPPF